MFAREATAEDTLAISILLDTAFETVSENRLVAALRASDSMALELVACERDSGGILGYVAMVKLDMPDMWWSLSPVAVLPRHQRKGVGGTLIREALDRARQSGVKAVTVLGDPAYYKRFGFSLDAARRLHSPYSRNHTMLYPLAAGISGAEAYLVYPAAFSAV